MRASILNLSRTFRLFFVLGAVGAAGVFGCSGSGGSDSEQVGSTGDGEIGHAAQALFPDTTKKWPATRVTFTGVKPAPISVCWLNDGFETEKQWVRESVEMSWVAHSRVTFSGWGKCDLSQHGSGIRIRIADEWPRSPLGTDHNKFDNRLPASDETNTPMTLNFTYVAWTCARTKERCTRWTAAHEFGHALGFAHEQDRGDHPAMFNQCVREAGTTDKGDHPIGPWDSDSIMNYCNNPLWNPSGKNQNYENDSGLSPIDIMGVQVVYGRKFGGSMVSPTRGRCLGVYGDFYTNGSAAMLQDCDGLGSRSWSFNADGELVNLHGRCLDVTANLALPLQPLQQWDCLPAQPNQKFGMKNVQLRILADKCVHAQTNAVGAPVVLGDCTGNTLDQWTLDGNGQVRLAAGDPSHSDLCLDVWGGNATSSPIRLGACSNVNDNKRWKLGSGGTLAAFGGADGADGTMHCLDVANFDTANGATIALNQCTGLLNQQLSMRGHLWAYAQSGLEPYYVEAASFENGGATRINVRMETPTEEWQYYP